jgi:hypothetical protein
LLVVGTVSGIVENGLSMRQWLVVARQRCMRSSSTAELAQWQHSWEGEMFSEHACARAVGCVAM